MNSTPRVRKFRIRPDEPLMPGVGRVEPLMGPEDEAEAAPEAASDASAGFGAAQTATGQVPQPDAAASATPPPARAEPSLIEEPDDGFGQERFPTAAPVAAAASARPAKGARAAGSGPGAAEEIAAIRGEGLTGRQLRMARRLAQRHGLQATSDYEAVRMLRHKGIDPFKRSNVLELVVAQARAPAVLQPPGTKLPQTVRQPDKLPQRDVLGEDRRAAEVLRIQRDIATRRQRKLILLFARLSVFVFLPTFIAGWYFAQVATPFYATKTEFVIQQADGSGGSVGGLLSGTQFATSQDSITVQSYLQSRDAMLRLDGDLGFKSHFSQDFIDPVQRLDPNATNEAAYKIFKRNVKIGYDPTEGIVKMEVVAADPAVSEAFSRALISYAEERVDQLTQRLREDQMKGARESYEDAEAKVLASQQTVIDLQQQLGVLDPSSESAVVMSQVSNYEGQVQQKRLQLQQLLDNPSPNQARVDGVKGDIARMEKLIAELRASLTEGTGGTSSLATMTGQLRIAEADLTTRQMMLSQAAQQMELARVEANKQVRYLSTGVSPVAPDEATYPRVLENTGLAFFIFSGIYLMMSLTASLLREQVSA